MTQTQGNTDMNLLCCGFAEQASGLTEIFVATQQKFMATANPATSNRTSEQEQDWNNPFGYMGQEQPNRGSFRFAQPPREDRSIVNYSPRETAEKRDNWNNRETERIHPTLHEASNNNRALALQEEIVMSSAHPYEDSKTSQRTKTKPLTARQEENVELKNNHMMMNHRLDARALAARDAAHRSRMLRQQALLAKRTESTRPKKEVTPSDVRDPETAAGMKSPVEVELEEAAKNQACAMLNDEQYKFNYKAGIAAFSIREIAFNHRKTHTTLGPIV